MTKSELLQKRQMLRFDLLELRDELARQRVLDQISQLTLQLIALGESVNERQNTLW